MPAMSEALSPPDTPHFEARITPHRSMGPAGLRRLVAFILIVSSAVSTGLFFAGAWPVIGFNGAEIALAIVLLRRNARQKDRSERLILSAQGLRIIRTEPSGRVTEHTMDGAWLNAVLQERPGRAPGLLLVHRGRQLEVGNDLGEAERRALAEALKQALWTHRNPRFDNPQLQ